LESLNSGERLKSHLTLIDGPYRPSDQFLRLHFKECLAVSVCRGDIMEDYGDQEIVDFMEELGIYDDEIDTSDPRWSTALGSHVRAYLLRKKTAELSVMLYFDLGNTSLKERHHHSANNPWTKITSTRAASDNQGR